MRYDVVERERLGGDPVEVAPWLLGKLLVSGQGGELTIGRIAEVEAYREDDPASHSYSGPTRRTATMFGPPGHLYVYLSYGIHRCANVSTGPAGHGSATLLRAVRPLHGRRLMAHRRGREEHLTDGPGNLCEALGIHLADDGLDVCAPWSPILLADDGTPPPARPIIGPRVGISKAVDRPWRFRVPE